jgi:uncharacterized protein (UPF0261 family)
MQPTDHRQGADAMEASRSDRAVLIIATLDTKSAEVIHLKNLIEKNNLQSIILDTGILGEPQGVSPTVPASETALAAGMPLSEVRRKPSRGAAVEVMLEGAKVWTRRLYEAGRIHGAISMGGAEGGVMAAAAMQVLPPGFPKVIITPLASGIRPFGPFIGIRDIMVMHSLVDIAGINEISRTVFDNAGHAICGMVKNYRPMEIKSTNLVPITTLGTTDWAMRHLFNRLKAAGFEPIIFHTSGVGGQVMEDMISRGFFHGVVDLCPNELTDHQTGGFHDAGPGRLETAGRMGIPQVVSTGCMDFFAQGGKETIPEKWRGRKMYYHNPAFTLIRPSHAEMRAIGVSMAEKLNRAKGPVRVVLPLKGMSIGGKEGGSTYDPEGDRILYDTLSECLKKEIPVVKVDRHINDEEFADRMFQEFMAIAGRKKLG